MRLKRDEANPSGVTTTTTKSSEVGDENKSERLDTDRTCYYNPSAPGSVCELLGNQFFTNYTSLAPGTLYWLDARTFSGELNSIFNSIRCKTEVDNPGFRRFSSSQGRLKLEFTLPKTEFCNITFDLMEKDGAATAYFEQVNYQRFSQQPGVFTDTITFQRKISSKYGVEYSVKVTVLKLFPGIEFVAGDPFTFSEIYYVPFPGNLSH